MSLFDRLLRRVGRGRADPLMGEGFRRLFVDVSTIAQHDARTGIQRVVRAVLLQLLHNPPDDFAVVPVAAMARRGYCAAPFDPVTGKVSLPPPDSPLLCGVAGDIFLGLDLAAHRLSRHRRQIAGWRRRGVAIHVVVYDLLPLQHPEWFPASTARNFRKWLQVLARLADGAVCISHAVALDLEHWLAANAVRPVTIAVMPLSGAVEASNPSHGMDEEGRRAIDWMRSAPTVLMVGTIEPRKGHDAVLAAMERLWRERREAAPNLLIIGRLGWHMEGLQRMLNQHPERGSRLRWLGNASDELLLACYAHAALVIVASRGEGFGLPIVEARQRGLKVLARDLPVFHEQADEGVFFFSSDAPERLADDIMHVLKADGTAAGPAGGWIDSIDRLLLALGTPRTRQAGSVNPAS